MTLEFSYEQLFLKEGGSRPFRFFLTRSTPGGLEEFALTKDGEWIPTDMLALARRGHNDVVTTPVDAEQAHELIEKYWGVSVAEKVFSATELS
jgi:hypothetical protein